MGKRGPQAHQGGHQASQGPPSSLSPSLSCFKNIIIIIIMSQKYHFQFSYQYVLKSLYLSMNIINHCSFLYQLIPLHHFSPPQRRCRRYAGKARETTWQWCCTRDCPSPSSYTASPPEPLWYLSMYIQFDLSTYLSIHLSIFFL